ETVDLCLAIIVVHRSAYDVGEATCLHVEACRGEAGDGDVDVLPGQGLAYLVGIVTGNPKTPKATAFSPQITHRDSRQGIEALAQHAGESSNARPDVVKSPREGIVNGHPQADLPGIVRLPILKTPGIRAEHQTIARYPLGSV